MSLHNTDQEFSVALLIDDISIAKQISAHLRDMGIFAHFYNDLDEYWVSINTSTPDFSIIDVKKMSQADMVLKNHPKVKNQSLKFAFFYDKVTPLLASVSNYDHMGLINLDTDLTSQLKTFLFQIDREKQVTSTIVNLNTKIENLQKRTLKFGKDAEKGHDFENKFFMLEDLISRFGQVDLDKSFTHQVIKLFSSWDLCNSFGVYELNEFGQKLMSYSFSESKYQQLPDLWLNCTCHSGIELFAQEMAIEVAHDIFDANLRIIKINAINDNPEILVIAAFDEKKLRGFKWSMLESFLSSQYRQLLLQRMKEPKKDSRHINIWEAFQYLDDISFHQSRSKHKLVGVDFAPLVNVIKEKHSNRFYWKSFYSDFVSQLGQILTGNFKFVEFGVQEFLILIDQDYLEQDFKKLKSLTGEFAYWRYFEDSSLIMTTDMAPELRLIAPSSVNVIRHVQRQPQSSIETNIAKSQIRQREFPVN